jgi:hypothetical protein
MVFCAKRNNAYSVKPVSGLLALLADVPRNAGPSGRIHTRSPMQLRLALFQQLGMARRALLLRLKAFSLATETAGRSAGFARRRRVTAKARQRDSSNSATCASLVKRSAQAAAMSAWPIVAPNQ